MKTQYRVVLVMLLLMITAATGLVVLSRNDRSHAQVLYQDVVDERDRLFAAVYRLDGQPQESLSIDYTYWDDMVNFVKKPTKQFSSENLDTALGTYQVDGIWVYKTSGQLVYENNDLGLAKFDLPLSATQVKGIFASARLAHFFIHTDQGVMEVRAATIHPSNDPQRLTPPQGYFLVGRLYDVAYRQRLGANLKSTVDLVDPNAAGNQPDPQIGQVVVTKSLSGIDGQPVAKLQATSDAPSIRQLYVLSADRLKIFAAIVIPALLILLWFLTRYVAWPLGVLSQSLKSKDPSSLDDLTSSRTEFGQIALLLQDYFKLSSQQLGAAHTRLRASINSINIGFVMTDADKQVIIVNDAARRILFDDAKRNRETSLSEITKLLPKVELERTIDTALGHVTSHSLGEVPVGEKFLRIYVAPVTETPGKPPVLGSIILFEDVTLERSLKRARDEFFSIASHELRTPLTVIMGNAAMIEDHIVPKAKDADLDDMVKDIYDSSHRLIQMVNDFLDTSRLEQGRIKFDLGPVDLNKTLTDLVKQYQAMVKDQGLTLKFVQMRGRAGQVKVRADQAKLQQVLINLLSNAVTFTHKGGITLQLDPHDSYARVFVIDTGEGIPLERHHLLFKKFQQAEENILSRNASKDLAPGAARDTTHGTGLGLYISKLLVEGMGGLIRLESSEPGKGSTFSVTLPAYQPSQLKKGGKHE